MTDDDERLLIDPKNLGQLVDYLNKLVEEFGREMRIDSGFQLDMNGLLLPPGGAMTCRGRLELMLDDPGSLFVDVRDWKIIDRQSEKDAMSEVQKIFEEDDDVDGEPA